MKKTVILIHGFMSGAYMMRYMETQIIKAGYEVYKFNYKSNKYTVNTLNELHKLIETLEGREIFLIGHSMGGLVARNYLHYYEYNKVPNNSTIKALITIATPHNQSLSAHAISNSMFKKLFGTAGDSGLTKEIPEWNTDIPIGCIAGKSTSKLSANLFLPKHNKEEINDGTIFLTEALLANCNDKIIIQGSHTGLIFKKEVATQCLYFLEHKEFKKSITNNVDN